MNQVDGAKFKFGQTVYTVEVSQVHGCNACNETGKLKSTQLMRGTSPKLLEAACPFCQGDNPLTNQKTIYENRIVEHRINAVIYYYTQAQYAHKQEEYIEYRYSFKNTLHSHRQGDVFATREEAEQFVLSKNNNLVRD